MTGNDLLRWGLAAAAGLGIGGFYFYGLWWTLGRLAASKHPRFLLGAGYLVRVFVAMLGFWLVIRNDVVSFFFTLAGFFLVRVVLTRTLGPPEDKPGNFITNRQA
ncbi:ATP synthase subunit I [Desulfococcus sp.]|uniref:N-ATPase subunit AtpR n=1 Tax=Desulfococcus sp. TaxID=2025834 RepID=UPI003593D54C